MRLTPPAPTAVTKLCAGPVVNLGKAGEGRRGGERQLEEELGKDVGRLTLLAPVGWAKEWSVCLEMKKPRVKGKATSPRTCRGGRAGQFEPHPDDCIPCTFPRNPHSCQAAGLPRGLGP